MRSFWKPYFIWKSHLIKIIIIIIIIIYYVAIATVIFSHVKITCYFHVWRYHVFARKLTWYFIGVYLIKSNLLQIILQWRLTPQPGISIGIRPWGHLNTFSFFVIFITIVIVIVITGRSFLCEQRLQCILVCKSTYREKVACACGIVSPWTLIWTKSSRLKECLEALLDCKRSTSNYT